MENALCELKFVRFAVSTNRSLRKLRSGRGRTGSAPTGVSAPRNTHKLKTQVRAVSSPWWEPPWWERLQRFLSSAATVRQDLQYMLMSDGVTSLFCGGFLQ